MSSPALSFLVLSFPFLFFSFLFFVHSLPSLNVAPIAAATGQEATPIKSSSAEQNVREEKEEREGERQTRRQNDEGKGKTEKQIEEKRDKTPVADVPLASPSPTWSILLDGSISSRHTICSLFLFFSPVFFLLSPFPLLPFHVLQSCSLSLCLNLTKGMLSYTNRRKKQEG